VITAVHRLLILTLFIPSLLLSQENQGKFTPDDYKRALWMVTRFYGAQRSGKGPNWLIMQHDTVAYRTSFTDIDNGKDLSGGWFDCGDHVTFGQTFFYSAYMLAKAYDMFPTGFHDLYNGWDYSDYVASGNWDMAGGTPDGIPDLLQELKYATDWIIKATPDGSTFYYQKGDGDKDHKLWVTAGKMATMPTDEGGDPRPIFKNPDDGVMASFAAAALAVMARIFKKYDSVYTETCLEHAKFAYAYAQSHKESSVGSGGYYGAAKSPLMAFIAGASELYRTTGSENYKNDAAGAQDKIQYHNWGFDYSNMHDLAPLAMATSDIDAENKLDQLKTVFIDQYTTGRNGEGVCTKGNGDWGALRYPANHAFIAASWAKEKNDQSLDEFIFAQADYIMGANNAGQSFIVGFCSDCSKQVLFPHHRNVYLRDDNPDDDAKSQMNIPARNEQFGYLVGGTWNSNDYRESVTDYAMTEGGIDYNAGLIGTLGYIVSKLAPADTAAMVGIVPHRFRTVHRDKSSMLSIVAGPSGWRITSAAGSVIEEIRLFDYSGRIVRTLPAGDGAVQLLRKDVPQGILTLRATLRGGAIQVAHFCTMR
jgi:endoglucanase